MAGLQNLVLGMALLLPFVLLSSVAEGQTVEVKPREIDDLLANPRMGWETFHRFADTDRNLAGLPSSTAYFRYYWKDVEPEKDVYNWGLLDGVLAKARAAGQKLAFRIMVCGTHRDYNYSPAYLKDEGYAGFEYSRGGGGTYWAPDLADPDVLERHLKLIRALGRRYDGHPDVAHVDIGSVGLWGEWHMSGTGRPMPPPEVCRRIVDTYFEAFPNTELLMLIGPLDELKYAASKGAGWRADCLGDMGGFSRTWSHMKNMYPQRIGEAGLEDAWQNAPVAFETCWDMRKWQEEGWDIDYIFEWALSVHASYVNNKSAPLPEGVRGQVEAMLRRLGYRFVLRSLRHPAAIETGGDLTVEMDWENVGVAPCYADYVPALSLVDAQGERVWVGLGRSCVREWLPGRFTLDDEFRLPAGLPKGEYGLEVAIVDAKSREPVVRLAIEGRADSGWYPLSRTTVR